MVKLDRIIATVAQRLQLREGGRALSGSLASELTAAARSTLIDATVALRPQGSQPSPSPAGEGPSSADRIRQTWLRDADLSIAVAESCLQILAHAPGVASFFSHGPSSTDNLLYALFMTPTLLQTSAASSEAFRKGLLSLVDVEALPRRSTTNLVLAIFLLGSHQSIPEGDGVARDVQIRSAQAYRLVMELIKEIMSRLPKARTTGAGNAAGARGRLQRRQQQGDSAPAAGRVDVVDSARHESRLPAMVTVSGDDSKGGGGTPTIANMLRTSRCDRVTEEEYLLFLVAATKAAANLPYTVASQAAMELAGDVYKALAASDAVLRETALVRNAAQLAREGQLTMGQWEALLALAAAPPEARNIATTAGQCIVEIARCVLEEQAQPLAQLSVNETNRIRAAELKYFLFRAAMGSRDSDGPQLASSVFPSALVATFRTGIDTISASQRVSSSHEAYQAAVDNLPPRVLSHLAIFLVRLYERYYHSFLKAPKMTESHMRPTDALTREMDALCDATQHRLHQQDALDGDTSQALRLLLNLIVERSLFWYHAEGRLPNDEDGRRLLDLVEEELARTDGGGITVQRNVSSTLSLLSILVNDGNATGTAGGQIPARAADAFCAILSALEHNLTQQTSARRTPRQNRQQDGEEDDITSSGDVFSVLLFLRYVIGSSLRGGGVAHETPQARSRRERMRAAAQSYLQACVMLANSEGGTVTNARSTHAGGVAPRSATVALALLLELQGDSTRAEQTQAPGSDDDNSTSAFMESTGSLAAAEARETSRQNPAEAVSVTTLRETAIHVLETLANAPAEAQQAGDAQTTLDLVLNLMQLGVFDAAHLNTAASAIRAYTTPAHIMKLNWRTRTQFIKKCHYVYALCHPHFVSSSGCRQIGQLSLVAVTRACLEKYTPQSTGHAVGDTAPRHGGDNLNDATMLAHRCAEAVFGLCSTAVEHPLRKCPLEKYLIVMARFARRYWMPPPSALLASAATDLPWATLLQAERALQQKYMNTDSSNNSNTVEAGSTTLDRDDGTTPSIDSLVRYNDALLAAARHLLRLTFAMSREDRDVRTRKIRQYYEMHFTLCFLLLKQPNAVVPSVWRRVSQLAVAYPRVFSPSGNFTPVLQKTLEVSFREVLRYVEETNNTGRWAGQNGRGRAPGDDAGVGATTSLEGPLISAEDVARMYSVIHALVNVDARLTLTALAQQAVRALPQSSSDDHTEHSDGERQGSVEDDDDSDIWKTDRKATAILLNVLQGGRNVGKRTTKL